jgi:hypothetical protein
MAYAPKCKYFTYNVFHLLFIPHLLVRDGFYDLKLKWPNAILLPSLAE